MDAKLFVGMPTRGRPNHYADRAAMHIASQYKAIYHIRQSWAVTTGRNGLVQLFLKSDCTHLLFVDDDTIIPHDAGDRLFALDAPVAVGVYPLVFNGSIGMSVMPLDWQGSPWPEPWIEGAFPVLHSGLGCALIRREVFEAMKYPWFTWLETKEGGYVGEDIEFCRKTRAAGFEILCDGDLHCGHDKNLNLLTIVPAAGRMRAENARQLREFLTPESLVTDTPGADAYASDGNVGAEHEVSTFLGALVYLLKPSNVLETGTHAGQTTLAMALAAQVNGGHIVTLDLDYKRAVAAEQLCASLPVQCFDISSLDYVAANPHDFLFLDCVHPRERERVLQHLIKTKSLIRRAWIVIHDVIESWGGHKRYLKYMDESLLLPCPRGLFVGRLKDGSA